MEIQFYYADANSQPVGPLSLDEIRRFAEAGVVAPDVMICEADGKEWRPLNSFPEKGPLQPFADSNTSQISTSSVEKPRHVSMTLTDSEKTPKFLQWGCNVAMPIVIGIAIAFYGLVKLLELLGLR